MLKKLYALKNKKGFTLVELMVVVAIMGILVAVAVPVYNNVTEKATIQTIQTNCRSIDSAIMQYNAVQDTPLAKGAELTALNSYFQGNALPAVTKGVSGTLTYAYDGVCTYATFTLDKTGATAQTVSANANPYAPVE